MRRSLVLLLLAGSAHARPGGGQTYRSSPSRPSTPTPSHRHAGTCSHCDAGEFDWVLSKIEQDDSYRG